MQFYDKKYSQCQIWKPFQFKSTLISISFKVSTGRINFVGLIRTGILVWIILVVSVKSPKAQSTSDSLILAKSPQNIQRESDSLQQKNVEITKVFVVGNRRTKERIILRELSLGPGSKVMRSDLPLILEKDREKLINTSLFLEVNIQVIGLSEDYVDLVVQVKERWYFFPSPIFKLADRSFNEWWANQDRDLSRVNYGLKLFQYNFRGRQETLKLVAQFGFTQTFALNYVVPSFDQNQRNGLRFDIGYSDQKNLAYRSTDNKQTFIDSEEVLRRSFFTSLTWSHRYSFYNRHFVTLGFNRTSINDTIAQLNPNYFLDGQNLQRFFTLSYRFTRDHRDNIAYPLEGNFLSLKVEKNGLGIYNDLSRLWMRASFAQYFPLENNFYLSSRITGLASFPKRQAYFNTAAIGYRPDDIRGYDLYVVEGQNYLLNKISLKKLLFFKEQKIRSIPIPQFQTIPIAVYLKTFFDSGYVDNELSDPENKPLSNRYLFGGGAGLDIVTYYDLVLRLEYSFNDRGNSGFFVNIRAGI